MAYDYITDDFTGRPSSKFVQ